MAHPEVAEQVEKTSPKSRLRNFLKYVVDHYALFAALSYLVLTILGMEYSWALFSEFGINIFEFAELNDFLLAAFKETSVLMIFVLLLIYSVLMWTLSTIAMVALSDRINKLPQSLRTFLRVAMPIAMGMVGALYAPIVAAEIEADNIRKNSSKQVDVMLRTPKVDGSDDRSIKGVRLIGATKGFLFFYDDVTTTTAHTLAIPVANIAMLYGITPSKTSESEE